MGHIDYGAHNGGGGTFADRAGQSAVEFDDVGFEFGDDGKAGETIANVVDRDAHTTLANLAKLTGRGGNVVVSVPLDSFEDDLVG